MGTWILAFAFFVLILQVVSGAFSAFAEKSRGQQWKDVNKDFRGGAINNYMQDGKPLFRDDEEKFDYNNDLDDVYESQLPPPPTQEDMSKGIRFVDETANAIRGTSKDSTPDDINVLSGAGQLETNEIVKNPNALLKENSETTSIINNDDEKVEINNKLTPIISKHAELDKAVENAIKSLPSAEESHLVPLIKIFNEKVQKQSRDENGNLEDNESKNFLNKLIVLKLVNKVQREQEEKAAQTKDFNLNESQTKNENESTQVQNLNEDSDDNPPCDCQDGCDGDMRQNQSESEQVNSPDSKSPSEDEVELNNDNRNPKIVAHLTIMLRKPKTEDPMTKQVRFSNSREQFVPFQPDEDSPLAHMFLGGSTSKYTSKNANPSFPFEEDEDKDTREGPSMQENVEPIALRMIGDRLATDMAEGCDHMNDNIQEETRESHPRFSPTYNDKGPSIPDIQRIQSGQPIPKESLILRHLFEILKEKAAADALRGNQERQIPQFFSSPSFYDSPKVPSSPVTKIAIIRPVKQMPQPELPPLHFPDENSGFEIRRLDDSRVFHNFGQEDQNDSDSDSELRPPVQMLSKILKMHRIQDSSEQPSYNLPQELPLFIKNILASLIRQEGVSNIQPIPTKFIPVQKPAEEKSPVLFRAAFSPFVL